MAKQSKLKHSDLLKDYTDGASIDQEHFAEQRSSVLIYSGEHYNKRVNSYFKRIRDSKELSSEQKLRLTKNHTQYICDTISNGIVSANIGVGFNPKNEKELHDQKVAELDHAVWRDAHSRYNVASKIDDWADNYVQMGEVFTKIYFDPMKGKVKGYEQKTNEEGQPLFIGMDGEETTDDGSMMGMQHELAQDLDSPIHEGEFIFDDILGCNVIRPVNCKDIRKAEFLTIRSMVARDELIARFPDKESIIVAGTDETYVVFDSTKGGYTKTKDDVLLLETYFRPSSKFPNGYYIYFTKEGILQEGELPGGIFPIACALYRKVPTAPRGFGPIKTMRPYQAEINRSASKIAEHQITLGDDKLLIQNGTKVSNGVALPGVRSINYTGMSPTILSGRDGSQYLAYMQAQITEMYQVMGVKEAQEENPSQLDPYVMLFQAARKKRRFQRQIKGLEMFLIDIVKIYLELARVHLPDDYLVYAIGNTERVNIPEFRQNSNVCYDIEIESQSDDVESKLGKQLVINHTLQYIGPQMKPDDIGKMLRQMPYANFDESFNDLTLDYDNSVNDILALDRGETPPVNQYDNHVYSIKRLVSRMRQADFKYLSPQIQQMYVQKVNVHQQFEAQNQMALQRASQGLIPTGGYLSKCDLYVADPKDPNKSNRVSLPSESLQWLVKQLDAQRAGMAPLANMNEGAQAQIADKVSSGGQQPAMSGNGIPSIA